MAHFAGKKATQLSKISILKKTKTKTGVCLLCSEGSKRNKQVQKTVGPKLNIFHSGDCCATGQGGMARDSYTEYSMAKWMCDV